MKNRSSNLLCCFLLLPLLSFGQKEFGHSIVEKLADSSFHGRGYVKKGHLLAADFLEQKFEEYGLKSFEEDYRQEFEVDVNTFPGAMGVKIGERSLAPGKEFIVNPSSGSCHGIFQPYLVDKENYTEEHTYQDFEKEGFLQDHILVLDPRGIKDKDSLKRFLSLKYLFAKKLPVIVLDDDLTWGGSTKAFPNAIIELLPNEFQSGQPIEVNIKQEFKEGLTTQNVIGYLPGTEHPDEYIVLSAHYDHLGRMGKDVYIPGANDNGSGTAMLLYMAKYFSEHPPEHSIAFMAFGAEEIGILGSKHYVDNPLFPLEDIRFLINLDLLGTGSKGATVVNGKVHETAFSQLVELNKKGRYLPKIKSRGAAANSDHHPFSEKGVPAFFIYTLGGIDAYHDIHDKAETLPLTEFNDVFALLRDFVLLPPANE